MWTLGTISPPCLSTAPLCSATVGPHFLIAPQSAPRSSGPPRATRHLWLCIAHNPTASKTSQAMAPGRSSRHAITQPMTTANPRGNGRWSVMRTSVPRGAKQTCTSALCAVTMPLAIIMVSGPVKDAKPSLKGVSKDITTTSVLQPTSAPLIRTAGKAARPVGYASVMKWG